ncbi:hypothetical protein I7I50_12230 [Histoplasma capsulatum G186AR]|uniref:Uncharacterized protein n=1 Tax=Ajellomyces capsulatus TaxID=5037 RepID=A0A8H8CR40_AJECA|nr:hypothetical protein I7I52_11458 [Histoplasma capsulatum]QSS70560.1 hypothetical protein I7I50_12230 [Histoplasma capsulatum G186AR]
MVRGTSPLISKPQSTLRARRSPLSNYQKGNNSQETWTNRDSRRWESTRELWASVDQYQVQPRDCVIKICFLVHEWRRRTGNNRQPADKGSSGPNHADQFRSQRS